MRDISGSVPSYKAIPIICGPTASGKSAIANELCLMTGGELVSCDSMQIYKGLDVGTAKPTRAEQQAIPHHMIDIVDPATSFSVNDFRSACIKEIEDILGRRRLPVLCGGTGQYVSALRDGIRYVDEPIPEDLVDSMYEQIEDEGPDKLYAELQEVDPAAASKIHPNNKRRVVRALAVYKATGKTMSEWNSSSKMTGPEFPFILFEPDWEEKRDLLYDRINKRVDIMMDQGLEAEARKLYGSDAPRSSTCFQAIGYKEFADYLSAEEGSPDKEAMLRKAIYDIKLNSRHYAKRQLTWFRYIDGIIKLPCDNDPSENAERILKQISAG
ncbi:MAG: tRNA (adenosine(37)-N6)-dimethylallyltransferase MiaA [Clostridiales bacterium]|nr:tRNA (adenosine(37)-N6)-dimethylallyltransferase MiaA [Clostridiales bacterium]